MRQQTEDEGVRSYCASHPTLFASSARSAVQFFNEHQLRGDNSRSPKVHDCPQDAHFANMIGIVRGNDIDFTQNCMPFLAMRNLGI